MMPEETAIGRVCIAQGVTDLRKSIDGLAAIVKEEFDLDPFSSCLFVFCNRSRYKLKILVWEHNGFWFALLQIRKREV
jgi:transposase